jgi:hypothetical protein
MAREIIQKKIELNKDTVDWIVREYPDNSLTWLINTLLDNFKQIHDETPLSLIKAAAKITEEGMS